MLPFLKLLRPHQWIKNLFVLAGLIFGHDWNNPHLLQEAIIAVIAFTLIASSMYIVNDIIDREEDRAHLFKKNRPIAAGLISTTKASIWAVLLGIAGLALGFIFTHNTGWILVAYILMTLAYTFKLKEIILVDVFIIALGFLLRVLAGTTGIGIPPSPWLLLCTFLLALFLGFCKRRTEIKILLTNTRLPSYPSALLNTLIAITASGSLLSYALYALHQDQLLHHSKPYFIWTIPFVIYGLFRYLYLLEKNKYNDTGLDMARDIIRDTPLLMTLFLWITTTLFL